MLKALLKLISKLFCLLPVRWGRALGHLFGALWYHVLRIRRRVVLEQLRAAFPRSPLPELQVLRRGVFRTIGLNLAEFLMLPKLLKTPTKHLKVDGLEHLEQALRRGRGVLILTAHLGNWELLMNWTAQRFDVGIVSKSQSIKGADGFTRWMRSQFGARIFPVKQSLVPMLSHLKNNGVIGFVIDQHMPGKNAVLVDFFGRRAATTPGLALMAFKSKAVVIPAFIHRDKTQHRIEFQSPVDFEHVTPLKLALKQNTERYSKIIEAAIRRHPEQWLWLHRRWKAARD